MSNLLTRRALITTASAAGIGGATYLAGHSGLIPPDYKRGILGLGETLTYAAQRLLTAGQPLAREFTRDQISKVSPVNGLAPTVEPYRTLAANGFADWRLNVEGLVTKPGPLSLADLKSMPMQSHTILHACEEGWSFIAEWTGVRLSRVLEIVGIKPEARYVVFYPFENMNQNSGASRVLWDGIDMADALHPQTLLAYGMNSEDLPPGHGAPVRLRMSRQLGYKNIKYLSRMVVTDKLDEAGDIMRRGTWYGGI